MRRHPDAGTERAAAESSSCTAASTRAAVSLDSRLVRARRAQFRYDRIPAGAAATPRRNAAASSTDPNTTFSAIRTAPDRRGTYIYRWFVVCLPVGCGCVREWLCAADVI